MPIAVGAVLPHIHCETQNGQMDLDAYRASKALVIWAYPKDNTAG
ncbi:MAG TPA: hypothetical protein VKT51_12660 [Candidatus Eremiobacteraceae bacterium]|nr:hypothetical protein [Candidatus Eremiobacteraceae bacterium]